ncbi:right-handed parallel beta-helix repeat-containing protein [Rivibacter subsaxonicus]|uniref:Parallel beta helix pectate lyase-like protein n=1 Tax=Rivibacter subsaxonicus TaxID=457575 RepID=A0A4Q7VW88_9BURK|nr:right-handed parallel beta-helix repeat-containing protein [Rivibacter subsaxonicus]RZU00920.1 parallel beta helix pectate lyase-like protein [Rivibacter subsaxonicus]
MHKAWGACIACLAASFLSPAAAAASGDGACMTVPGVPAVPGSARKISDFGARADDAEDDTAQIQAALDSLAPGEWLVFDKPGRYLIGKRLSIRRPNVTVYGAGATIHATNPSDQAIMIQADGVRLYRLTKTAVTTSRQSTPWSAGIAVYLDVGGKRTPVKNVVIQGNTITNAGPDDSPEANGAASAGIILFKAYNFLVAENTVKRSLADGIHITSGSRDGRVLANKVRESGDDMLAVVSYVGGKAAESSGERAAEDWATRQDAGINKNIVLANNDLQGQYWGRGISLLGVDGATVKGNTVAHSPMAAGILVARESSYLTFGVNNALIEGNTLREIQTSEPSYNRGGKWKSLSLTGHGAIELQNMLFKDEAAIAVLRQDLAVRNVLVRNNTIDKARGAGVRVGAATGIAAGERLPVRGSIESVGLDRNTMTAVGSGLAITAEGVQAGSLWCSGNKRDGQAATSNLCQGAAAPSVKGAACEP